MSYSNFELPAYPCVSDMWDALASENRPIVVYGMGNGADKLIRRFEKYNIEIADFFASDGFVRGHSFHGKRVKSFSEIKEEYEDFIIVLSFASNRKEVIDMLADINRSYDMLVPDMPVAGEDEYFDREFFNSHYEEIKSAYDAFCDRTSKCAYSAIINYRLSGKMEYLLEAFSEREEIYSLLSEKEIKVAVDAGAYNGDTAREMIKYLAGIEKIYAIEPDPKNFKKLQKYAEETEQTEVVAINAAVWSEDGTAEFKSGGNRNSSISSTASFKSRDDMISVVSVDSVAKEGVDYIKYDVEGAEKEAIEGSRVTILDQKPALLVSLYHRSKDIFYLVNLLKSEFPFYRFYLRRLLCVPAWEIDLIMIPTE